MVRPKKVQNNFQQSFQHIKRTVAVAIPRQPAEADKEAPPKKQREYRSPSILWPEGGSKKYRTNSITATQVTKTAKYLYSVVRKALAPTLI